MRGEARGSSAQAVVVPSAGEEPSPEDLEIDKLMSGGWLGMERVSGSAMKNGDYIQSCSGGSVTD